MTPEQELKLKQVLDSNSRWPIVVVGMAARRASSSVVIPATVDARDLNNDSVAARPFILIDGLDTIPPADQAKFIPLIKDRRIGTRRLAPTSRVIIPVRSADNLAREIRDLVLIYNA